MKQVLIVGSGDVARRIIPWLQRRFRVCAVVRRPEERAACALGATTLIADLDKPESRCPLAGIADYVLHCAPPPNMGSDDPRTQSSRCADASRESTTTAHLRHKYHGRVWRLRRRLAGQKPVRRIRPRPGRSARCSRMPPAAIWRAHRMPGQPAGAGHLRWRRAPAGGPTAKGRAGAGARDDVFTNHIHADDLARLLGLALCSAVGPTGPYNASDDSQPADGRLFRSGGRRRRLPRPPRLPRAELAGRLSPMTLSFMSESRRLEDDRIKRELRAA